MVMLFAFCSCSSETLTDKARCWVIQEVNIQMMSGFKDARPYSVNIARLTPTDEYTWKTSGRASFTDEYGDIYSGTFEGTVEYNIKSDSFSVDIDLEDTFRKER